MLPRLERKLEYVLVPIEVEPMPVVRELILQKEEEKGTASGKCQKFNN
jgi:hypothetical protein